VDRLRFGCYTNTMKKASKIVGTVSAYRQAVVYARVSSKEQEKEGFSIPAQLKLLKEYAAANGFAVAQGYVDVETAKQTGRTGVPQSPAWPDQRLLKTLGRYLGVLPPTNPGIMTDITVVALPRLYETQCSTRLHVRCERCVWHTCGVWSGGSVKKRSHQHGLAAPRPCIIACHTDC